MLDRYRDGGADGSGSAYGVMAGEAIEEVSIESRKWSKSHLKEAPSILP